MTPLVPRSIHLGDGAYATTMKPCLCPCDCQHNRVVTDAELHPDDCSCGRFHARRGRCGACLNNEHSLPPSETP